MKMYKFFIMFFGSMMILLLTSCGDDGNEDLSIPSNILSEQAFTELLIDLALAESASNMNVKNVPIHKIDSVYRMNPLLEHNIRKSQYDSTVRFYISHPDVYKRIYDQVIASLNRMQAVRDTLKRP